MAGQFQLRQFFRTVSFPLLAEYFDQRGIALESIDSATGEFQPVDVRQLDEDNIEPLWEAWPGLDEVTRSDAESDFCDIAELGDEAGIQAVLDATTWHNLDLGGQLAALDDPLGCSIWVFLHCRDLFDDAFRLYEADRRSNRQWQKRKGLPQRAAESDADATIRLAGGLSDHFRKKEACGDRFKVEYLERSERQYFFAYGEDHARAEQDFVEGELRRRSHRPAFEVIFVFDPKAGSLDICARGGKLAVQKLQTIFTRELLHHEIVQNSRDDRAYDLEPFANRAMSFAYEPGWGIASVSVVGLRVSLITRKGVRLLLEANTQDELYDRYERIVRTWANGETCGITQATVKVEYAQGGSRRRPSNKKFTVTYPSSCDLKQEERDLQLREMLMRSGIDPQGIGRDARRR